MGVGDGRLCPVNSETNRENFFSKPKEFTCFSSFRHSFDLSFPRNVKFPSI